MRYHPPPAERPPDSKIGKGAKGQRRGGQKIGPTKKVGKGVALGQPVDVDRCLEVVGLVTMVTAGTKQSELVWDFNGRN